MMVAYSFKQQFVEPILEGRKSHTVRADRLRHARPGEELQLYTGMRTRDCKLISRALCIDVRPIQLVFDDADPECEGIILPGFGFPSGLDAFAKSDGFSDWSQLKMFWRQSYPGVDHFKGVLITWRPLK